MIHLHKLAIGLCLALAPLEHGYAQEKPLGTFSSSGATSNNLYGNPNLRGVLVRVSWSDIEPSPGTFDFSAIHAQISSVEANGASWSLAIAGGGTGSPDWLTNGTTQGGLGAPFITYSFRGVPGYKLPLFWNSIVQGRISILTNALGTQYNSNDNLKLVYVTQMTANGNEGHLQGVDMNVLIGAGDDQDGDGDVDGADFQTSWIMASEQAARAYALEFPDKAIAFEVHDVNGSSSIPETIIHNLWNDPALDQRVGAAMWWISGKTSYQGDLVSVLTDFPGDVYGQVIGKSNDGAWLANTSYSNSTYRMPVNAPSTNRFRYQVTSPGTSGSTQPLWPTTVGATVVDGTIEWTCRGSRFESGDYTTVFSQAKAIGMRYIEPWEWEFKIGANSANGEWDAALADFNAWADASYGSAQSVGIPFCSPTNNSTGMPSILSGSVGDGMGSNLHLEATQGVPNEIAYILVGNENSSNVPISNGFLCLVGSPLARIYRYNVVGSQSNSIGAFDANGVLQNLAGTSSTGTGFDVPSSIPDSTPVQISSGDTWHFQLWHRDTPAGAGSSNFTNGLTVTFPVQ